MKEVFNSLGDLATQPDEYLHKVGKTGICISAGFLLTSGLLCYFFGDSSSKSNNPEHKF